ncbi:MAG: tetratricopeptide repeat protein, partial [Acidobacteria bacterium]|nr:tetratricopeptide repeat protein [Acidobacteriota bacterium]
MKRLFFLRLPIAFVIGFAFSLQLVSGQQQGQQRPTPSPSPSPSPGAGAGGSIPGRPSPGTPSPLPTPGRQPLPSERTQPFPEIQRPFFFSGKVMLDDGTPPPDSVVIERVCNGVARPEAYTDSKGRFSFQLGQNMNVMADASVGSMNDPMGDFGRTPGSPGRPGRQVTERDLMGCELRASLAGYRSDVVMLNNRRFLDNPDVGTIILHRMGNVEGTTISATSLEAPKDARKAFDKGRDAIKKKKFAEASKQLEKAVEIYPKYAVAWYELGLVRQQQNQVEPAREAYAKALAADAKFIKPYLELAKLSAQERNWQGVADASGRVIRLDPFDFPEAYFYNSVANFNLRSYDAAEKSAREAVKLDTQHRMPKASHLLGILLAN